MPERICSIDGCNRRHYGRGWCVLHWRRMYRYGRTNVVVIRNDDDARLWSKVDKRGPDECWPYLGARNTNGYGRARRNLVTVQAHRYVYELLVGPIPQGLELDHLCRNRACCNPVHLEPVTHNENVRRGARARPRQTHCKRGHLLEGDNVRYDKRGSRHCRECGKLRYVPGGLDA